MRYNLCINFKDVVQHREYFLSPMITIYSIIFLHYESLCPKPEIYTL